MTWCLGSTLKHMLGEKMASSGKFKNNWDNVDNCWSWVMDLSDFALLVSLILCILKIPLMKS